MKIRTKLFLIILIALAIFLPLMVIATYFLTKYAMQEVIRNQNELLAKQTISSIDKKLYEHYVLIEQLSKNEQITALFSTNKKATASSKLTINTPKSPDLTLLSGVWERIEIIDTTGKIIASSASLSGDAYLQQSSGYKTVIKKALGGETAYSDMILDPESKKQVMLFASSIQNSTQTDNAIQGVVIGYLSSEKIDTMLNTLSDSTVTLSNKSGKQIAGNQPSSAQKENAVSIVSANETGYLDFVGNGWVLKITTSDEHLFSIVWKNSIALLSYVIPIVLLAIGFIGFFVLRTIRPISSLIETTKSFSTGQFSKRAKIVSKDEIGNLAISFNSMADSIQNLYANLERSITKKTIELTNKVYQLAEAKAKDDAILASIGEGVVVTDAQGKIVFINEVSIQIFKLTYRETLSIPYNSIWQIQDEKGQQLEKEQNPIEEALVSGKKMSSSKYFFNRQDKDGAVIVKIPVAASISPIIMNDKIAGAIIVFRDITHEKEIDRMKNEFISLTSHELRTPMTAIKGFLSMILEGDYGSIPQVLKDPLTDIYSSVNRLIDLVNDMLNISRIEAGRMKFTIATFDLKPLITEVIVSLQPIVQKRPIRLVTTIASSSQVSADSNKVKQILLNLIGNSLKFAEKGEIIVDTKTLGERVIITVTDTGMGIAEDDQKTLFKKFQQISSQQQGKPHGTGLGLYLSREIIRKMGGDVWLEKSQLGSGSTFAFSLPLVYTNLSEEVIKSIEKET